jgi:two-component system, OmpR family, copper resistance phosphate regulon response regulator CusR
MRILLVEDEIKALNALRMGLEENGWTVNTATDGESGLRLALQHDYDVVVSDIIMPGMSGLELCRQMREKGQSTPVLLLSALGETDDKVSGLDAGADDYLTKPFELRELLARIKALSRRGNTAVYQSSNILIFNDLEQDLDARTVRRAGREILLTPREFSLLEFFMRNPGRVLSKTEIAEKVWDVDFDTGTNIIEVYLNYLRNKVDKGFEEKYIHTQFGLGYILRKG